MIENKEYRRKLIAKYLEAETTVEEEIALAEYYALEDLIDADEAAVARLILADHPEAAILSAEGEAEFDRIAAEAATEAKSEAAGEELKAGCETAAGAKSEAAGEERPAFNPAAARKRARGGWRSAAARPFTAAKAAAAFAFAFAAVALVLVLRPQKQSGTECQFTPMEIAQNIDTMFNMDTDEIESIVAEPKGANVILTAKMKDGSSNTFVMSRNPEDGSTKILAQNKSKIK